MASEKGPVATEAPPLPSAANSEPSVSVEALQAVASQADATRATASLKRPREPTPTSPTNEEIAAQLSAELSPAKAARLIGVNSRHSPAPLTGAAALEDERQRQEGQEEQYKLQVSGASENPAYRVQSELMSASALAMSRPQDAPMGADLQPNDPSGVSIPQGEAPEAAMKADISPQTETSVPSTGDGSAPATTSPMPMEVDPRLEQAGYTTQPQAQMEDKTSTSLSYPGLMAAAVPAAPVRGMSLPMTPGQQTTPRSPNSKKHKCPYCETEFTRHHNLKSHLLTHSQEKPFVCQTCQMRFRRLHDLKRHSKLHTGEKPHVCPKCDRKFARGDALARHSKGPGGCVSRRSSAAFAEHGGFEGDSHLEGHDDSAMSGVVYEGANEADLTEEERRRLSMPAIKAQQVQGNQGVAEGFAAHSRTYPPPGTAAGRLYPPNVERGSVTSNASHPPNPTMYSQTGMTESPKPLSPGLQGQDGSIARQRSPSLTTQFQQQHFGRHQTEHQTPAGSSHFSSYPEALVAQLDPVPGFSATDGARFAAAAQGLAHIAPGVAAASQASAGGPPAPTQPGGSGDSASNNMFATEQGLLTYVHSLEETIRELSGRVDVLETTKRSQEEKIALLTNELAALRNRIDVKSEPSEPQQQQQQPLEPDAQVQAQVPEAQSQPQPQPIV